MILDGSAHAQTGVMKTEKQKHGVLFTCYESAFPP